MTHTEVGEVHLKIKLPQKTSHKILDKMNYKGCFDKNFGSYCLWDRTRGVPGDINIGIVSILQQYGSY